MRAHPPELDRRACYAGDLPELGLPKKPRNSFLAQSDVYFVGLAIVKSDTNQPVVASGVALGSTNCNGTYFRPN